MIENGTIYQVDGRDWVYNGYKRIDPPEKNYGNTRIAYYQPEISTVSCSLHGAMTVVSNSTGIMFTLKERMEILELAKERGFIEGWGWYMNKAVKCVVDYCNSYFKMNLIYIRVPWTQYEELTRKGFGIVTGYNYKLGMGVDRSEDGILGNTSKEYGKTFYGHLFSLWNFRKRKDQHKEVKSKIGGRNFGLVDNYYPKHKHNETFIDNLQELVEEGVMFPNGYLIVEKKYTKATTSQMFKEKIRNFRKLIK